MRTPPRDSPCPCGSGKTYEHCCLRKDEKDAKVPTLVDIDVDLTMQVFCWLVEEHMDALEEVGNAIPTDVHGMEEYVVVGSALTIWDITDKWGRRLAEQFRDLYGASLEWGFRQCLDAHLDSWFSVWEVLEIFPDEGFCFRDLLTGEERSIRQKAASRILLPRETLMACILRFGASWGISHVHPHVLRPRHGAEVVRTFRRHLGVRTKYVDPERLKGRAAWELLYQWQMQVDDPRERPRIPLTNPEGDVLLHTVDRYTFDRGNTEDVSAALAALEGAEEVEIDPAEAPDVTGFMVYRPDPASEDAQETIIVARIHLGRGTLVVQTNSTRRAEDTRRALEEADVGLHHDSRTEVDVGDEPDVCPPDDFDGETVFDEFPEPDATPEERARIERANAKRYYEGWINRQISCLGGITPREASKDARTRVWHELDLALRELEYCDATLPVDQRYDMLRLRRDLGLPE